MATITQGTLLNKDSRPTCWQLVTRMLWKNESLTWHHHRLRCNRKLHVHVHHTRHHRNLIYLSFMRCQPLAMQAVNSQQVLPVSTNDMSWWLPLRESLSIWCHLTAGSICTDRTRHCVSVIRKQFAVILGLCVTICVLPLCCHPSQD